MEIPFYKYHGTGNDFILIDDRKGQLRKKLTTSIIKKVCRRRFGIGADGLILLQKHRHLDFKMVYFNSDGKTSSMCGNGARCIVAFAKLLGIINSETTFQAIDGTHEARISKSKISVHMSDVMALQRIKKDVVLNTGSPHYVRFVKNIDNIDTFKSGQKIRNSKPFAKKGINVNFVQVVSKSSIKMTTYERGVEAETYSCGTGVVAASLAYHYIFNLKAKKIKVQTKGGKLGVTFRNSDQGYYDIWLHGPAQLVGTGKFNTTSF